MESNIGFLSVLPSLVAIGLALWSRRVLPALLAGIVTAHLVTNLTAPLLVPFATLDHMVGVAGQGGNLRLVVFSLLIGGLIKLMRDAGGFTALSRAIEQRRNTINRRTVFGITYGLGIGLFLETWSNVLINGTTVASLYDRIGVSRYRLAYFLHTVAIAAVSLIPLNSWAAFYIGLLSANQVDDPFGFLLTAIPFMLYSWFSLVFVAIVMISGLTIGPMRQFDAQAKAKWRGVEPEREKIQPGRVVDEEQGRSSYVIVPIVTLLLVTVASLYVTGGGDARQGDGATSVLYAGAMAVISLVLKLIADQRFGFREIEERLLAGMSEFYGVAVLLVFALSLGDLCSQLGTGDYISALLVSSFPVLLLPALVFVLGAAMAFATGTSYGTFSILVPIALPLAFAADISPAVIFGAVISGGVFGDNCSPISDTTIITSVSAQVEVIDHVRSQLPYALIVGGLTTSAFVVLGMIESVSYVH